MCSDLLSIGKIVSPTGLFDSRVLVESVADITSAVLSVDADGTFNALNACLESPPLLTSENPLAASLQNAGVEVDCLDTSKPDNSSQPDTATSDGEVSRYMVAKLSSASAPATEEAEEETRLQWVSERYTVKGDEHNAHVDRARLVGLSNRSCRCVVDVVEALIPASGLCYCSILLHVSDTVWIVFIS